MNEFNPLIDHNPLDFELPYPSKVSRMLAVVRTLLAPKVRIIDLSHHNGDVDFVAVKDSGVDVVIFKATEGIGFQDEMFPAYWPMARDAGLKTIVYHFFRSNYEGDDQADYCLNYIEPFLGSVGNEQKTIVWGDVETADSVTNMLRADRLYDFCQYIENENLQAGYYSSPGLWSALMPVGLPWYGNYLQWVAHWTSAAEPALPHGWSWDKCKFWQYGIYPTHSWVAPVGGISGKVDCDWFLGSYDELLEVLQVPTIPKIIKVKQAQNLVGFDAPKGNYVTIEHTGKLLGVVDMALDDQGAIWYCVDEVKPIWVRNSGVEIIE